MKRAATWSAFALVLASCYAPATIRREQTTLDPQAGKIIASALVPDSQRRQQFDQHYQTALAFYNERKYPEAIAEFEAAYAVDPQALIVFNIGQAYRKGGRLEQALAKYREYLDKDPSAERGRVDELIKEVESALATHKTQVAPVR